MEDKNPAKINVPKKPEGQPNFTSYVPKPMSALIKEREKTAPSTVIKKEVSKPEVVAPRNKRKILTVIFLAVAIFLVLATTMLFIFLPKPIRPADITLEFKTYAEVGDLIVTLPDGSTSTNERTEMMPGDRLEATLLISAESTDNTQPEVFVRIRGYAMCEGNYYSNLFDFEVYDESQWHIGADGYYYFKGTLSTTDEPINAIKSIKLREEIGNAFAGKQVSFIFESSALQAEYQAIKEYWGTAPDEWSNAFKN